VKHWSISQSYGWGKDTILMLMCENKGYFSKCLVCESFKDLTSKLGKHSNSVIEYEMKLKKQILH
jgi:hypothetical protein